MRYITATDTAKIIRKRLHSTFPGVKFSVRTDKYAGGCSIRIDWTDGPSCKMVDSIVMDYQSRRFDGMIDMAFNVTHWLLPDMSAIVAHSPGSTGSMGVYEPQQNEKPHPHAEEVSFGSCYVTTTRRMSNELKAKALRFTARKWGFDANEFEIENGSIVNGWSTRIENAACDVATLVYREAGDICMIDPAWNIGQSDAWQRHTPR